MPCNVSLQAQTQKWKKKKKKKRRPCGAAHLLPKVRIVVDIPRVAVGPLQVKALPVVVLCASKQRPIRCMCMVAVQPPRCGAPQLLSRPGCCSDAQWRRVCVMRPAPCLQTRQNEPRTCSRNESGVPCSSASLRLNLQTSPEEFLQQPPQAYICIAHLSRFGRCVPRSAAWPHQHLSSQGLGSGDARHTTTKAPFIPSHCVQSQQQSSLHMSSPRLALWRVQTGDAEGRERQHDVEQADRRVRGTLSSEF